MPPAAGWLWNPWADLTIGCAGWTLPLLALTYLLSRAAWIDVAFAFSLLTLVCNHPHYMATWVRAFGSRESAAAYRFYTLHLSVLFGLALVAAHLSAALVPLLFTLYVVWSPWHYGKQNFGLLLLFARRRRAAPTAAERQLLWSAIIASYLLWLVMMNTQASTDPYVWSLALPPVVAGPVGLGLAIFFALAGAVALARMAGRAGWRAVMPCALLLSSQALWFVSPWLLRVALGRQLSPVYYSTGALAFMHCAQYLWVTSYYARRETGAAWQPLRYATVLGLGGIALFFAGPWVASALLGFDLRESMLIFIALVNLHHFVLDGAIWKLRDPRVAAVLTDPEPGLTMRPLPARAASPFALRPVLGWGLASALLAIAALTVVQQILTREGTGPRRLALAQRLNPRDSRVDVRRAELLAGAQQPDAALRVLSPRLDLRPANAPALRLYGSLLVATGRYAEADAHYQAVQRTVGLDPPGLVNAGVLAARDGRLDTAAAALNDALRLDPDLSAAHLNLAGVCLQRGDAAGALRHYDAFFAAPDVPHDRAYVAAGLNAASAAVLEKRADTALALLDASAALATDIGASDLAGLANRQAVALRASGAD
jgi:tetratricopeptide (TPR) repeat protein